MIVLDAKTDFSFLRGYGTPAQWRQRAQDAGVSVLGIADYCSTWGHVPFQDAFKDSGIKLIYGIQLPVVSFLDKDPRHSLVTLLATSSTDELYRLSTLAQQQTYYRPRLTWKQIADLKFTVVIVNDLLSTHAKAVPEGAYRGVRKGMSDALRALERPSVLAYGPKYPRPEDHVAYELFEAISESQRLGEVVNDSFHLLRQREVEAIFKTKSGWDDILLNQERIAALCTATLPRAKLLDSGVEGDKIALLRQKAILGALNKGLCEFAQGDTEPHFVDPAYHARLERELETIQKMKFEDYFFFITDVIGWTNERMLVGPGRGSAGGSLLCFLLGITQVDPLKFGTLFERFIDVTRPDLPDIDIDFPDNHRDEVFEYLKEKYGAERVARIGTLTELGGKSAINAVARVTDVPFEAAREVGKYTEGSVQGQVIPPKWIFENVKEVEPILTRHPTLRLASLLDERDTWTDHGKQHVSHHGKHAAGVVVTDLPICTYGTVDREGVIAMDMKAAEKQGLVKMDALGLRTLSVIDECCKLAGIDPHSLYTLDWKDKSVFDDVFNADRVTGIFQFEGHAVRTLMKQVRVDNFDDLTAITSLARPGPLIGGAAAGWVKARNGEAVGEMLHPALEETHGVIVYQEQFMAIARDIAGFNEVDVNGMRRAVGKKDPEKLRGYREKFIAGCTKHFIEAFAASQGRTADEMDFSVCAEKEGQRASDLWEEICDFGSYAFNKSHATAYSMISYMTAFLKKYHGLEFAVAQLRNAADDDQVKNLLRELIEEGYKYVPFDPDKSDVSWSIVDGMLYGGFDSIRGVGTKTAERMCALREQWGDRWLDKLTDAQRERIESGQSFVGNLSYFSEKFRALYDDPDAWRSPGISKGIKPPVYRIKDIPDVKGNYAFIGRITKRQVVDANAPERVAKRDGKKFTKDSTFLNLTIEDDTGEISGTINRFKFEQFKWLSEEQIDGRDFLFRGDIIENGRRWLFVANVLELKDVQSPG